MSLKTLLPWLAALLLASALAAAEPATHAGASSAPPKTGLMSMPATGPSDDQDEEKPADQTDRPGTMPSILPPGRVTVSVSTGPGPQTAPSDEEEALPSVPGMPPQMVRSLLETMRRNPAMKEVMLKQYPQLAEAMSQPASGPATAPAASLQELAAQQVKRRAAEALVRQLADAAPERLEAIEKELAQIGQAAMVPLKLAELSENFELRQRAVRLSGRLRWRFACGEPLLKARPTLVDVMSGADAQARAALVEQIAAAADRNAVGFLGECLADAQTYVRQQAIEGLVQAMQRESRSQMPRSVAAQISRFLEIALGDDDRDIRLLAVGAMAKIGAVNIQKMAELLADESLEVRVTAIRAMGFSGNAEAMKHLKALLGDPLWQIRASALEAIEKLSEERGGTVASLVAARLEDEDPYVRAVATRMLGHWSYRQAAPKLLELAKGGKLSEEAAFGALASMDYMPAHAELLPRYAQAPGTGRRMELLTLLSGFRKNAQTDRLLKEALQDAAMRDYRPQIIALLSRRDNAAQFMPLIWPLLESDDPAVAKAAWGMADDHARETAVPADLAARAMNSKNSQLGRWVLAAAYVYNPPDLPKTLAAAVSNPMPEVASLALAMIATDNFQSTLGDEVPSQWSRRRPGNYSPADEVLSKRREKLSPPFTAAAQAALKRTETLVRVRAAAVLFRSGADQGQEVQDILRAGLADADVGIRQSAMAGITEKPKAFLDRFDVLAASKIPDLQREAIELMANSEDPKYIDRLIALAGDSDLEDYEYRGLLARALIRSGDQKALQLVLDKAAKAESYELRSLAQSLAGMSGDGPVRFIEAALKKEKNEYSKMEYVKVLATLQSPLARPLLKQLLQDKQLARYGGAAEIAARLAETDPAEGAPMLGKLLQDPEQQYSAVQAIVKTKPSKEMVAIVLEIAKQKNAQGDLTGLTPWVPAESLRELFLPALGELNPMFQHAVLERLGGELNEKDLEALLKVSAADVFLRESLAGFIGAATAQRPEARRPLQKLSAPALINMLDAAGDWADAPAVLEPYLKDSQPEVGAAACRGLAYFLLGNPAAPATDAHRAAMLEAVKAKDAPTAYLAAEVLGQRWADELAKLDPNSIPSSTASLRQIVAMGDKVPKELRAKVARGLSGQGGATATQLAIVSAARSFDPSYPVQAMINLPRSDNQTRMLIDIILASGKEENLRRLLQWPPAELKERAGDLEPMIARLLAKAREGNGQLFLELALGGWIDKPLKGDLARLINAAAQQAGSSYSEYRYGYAYGGPDSGTRPLDLALSWAAGGPDEEVVKLIAPDRTAGVMAAAVVAIQWKLPAGKDALLKALAAKRSSSGAAQTRQFVAAKALEICATPQDAQLIAEAAGKLKADDYDQQQYQMVLLQVLAAINPADAAKAITPEQWERFGYAPGQWGPPDLLAALADRPGWPDGFNLQTARYISSEGYVAQALYNALVRARDSAPAAATMAPTGGPASATGPAAAPAMASARSMPASVAAPREAGQGGSTDLRLLPPWDVPASVHPLATAVRPEKDVAKAAMEAALSRIRQAGDPNAMQISPDDATGEVDEDEVMARAGMRRYPYPTSFFGSQPPPAADLLPEDYYAGPGDKPLPVSLYLDAEEVCARLRPLLADKSAKVRAAAMRAAADWQLAPMAEEIAKLLNAQGAECVEAAWALAAIQGRQAAPAIAKAWQDQKDFDVRVRLACVLRLLGNDAGKADIDQAVALRALRQFRLKFMESTRPREAYGQVGFPPGYRGPYPPGFPPGMGLGPADRGTSIRQSLLPWQAALQLAAPDLLEQDDARFPGQRHPHTDSASPTTAPAAPATRPVVAAATKPALETLDLSNLYIDSQGRLQAQLPKDNSLPLDSLCQPAVARPHLFARLCVAEQQLEPLLLVQFADQAANLTDLRDQWAAWWLANKDKGRDQWWRQALAQAVEELGHANWWHRARAVRRLARLTGQAVTPPNVFDLPQWDKLRTQWRQRLQQDPSASPRAWLLKAGAEAAVLPPGTEKQAGDDAACLAALVKLAGFAQQPLAEAALLQLQTWPDPDGLVRLSITWQHSPRRDLAAWARAHLATLTGKARFAYVPEDLASSAGVDKPR